MRSSPAVISVLNSYISMLSEMVVMEEANSTLLSSSYFFHTLCDLIHVDNIKIVYAAVQLLNRECEEVEGCADQFAQCLIEEKNSSNNFSHSTLFVLVEHVKQCDQEDVRVCILKFLTVLVYSIQSLSRRVSVRISKT